MKNSVVLFASSCLLLCASCADISLSTKEDNCHKQAESRLELYNKPDIFPISEKDRYNALTALFYECMRTPNAKLDYKYEVDTKNAKPAVTLPAPVAPLPNSASTNAVSYPAGTVVIVQSPPQVYTPAPETIKPQTDKIRSVKRVDEKEDVIKNFTIGQKLSQYPAKSNEDESTIELENIVSGNK